MVSNQPPPGLPPPAPAGHGPIYPTRAQRGPNVMFCVGELPYELREQIWKYLPPPLPRTVCITYASADGVRLRSGRIAKTERLIGVVDAPGAPSRNPALFSINQMTRKMSLKEYRFCFADQLGGEAVWFNMKIDKLRFNHIRVLRDLSNRSLDGCTWTDMFIPLRLLEIRKELSHDQLLFVARVFANLETLTSQNYGSRNTRTLQILRAEWDKTIALAKMPRVSFV